MEDGNIQKVAHFMHNDVGPLERRFPALKVRGVENLKPIAQRLAKTTMRNNRLLTYCQDLLHRDFRLKGAVDHSSWENEELTPEQQVMPRYLGLDRMS